MKVIGEVVLLGAKSLLKFTSFLALVPSRPT